ncbi:prolyl oligopeptidase family serine peptidase [Pelagicoccus sp. SDUM812002]|uniref:prolyl oligopeptidase family serine peptidase n=1 Tax=Pelagicoccus sp. SDUM812002 TaxID=3041266 RepID=UPI00280F73FF|nr:prolyl oligopeptidase family serine peptidase [Pelagicoccus sp. SDUM812002]MDQ8187729.1 prolyl oligopeptidase family serine peptidase [Pelagicoccus sp. SDUM812002]
MFQLTSLILVTTLLAMPASAHPPENDPHLWLEAVDSPEALAWVEQQNAIAHRRYAETALFDQIEARSLQILDSDERIPYPAVRQDFVYNFWQDEDNPRGLLRRSPKTSYLSGSPLWETVLDIDLLGEEEGVKWVYKGASWLQPDYQRCLMELSPGGGDAVEIREFDPQAKAFVADGFHLPTAKGSVEWVDRDTLLIATDFGPGSQTNSGYPRVVKRWIRNQPLDEATELFEGEQTDVGAWPFSLRQADGPTYFFVQRSITFFTRTVFAWVDGALKKLPIPEDSDVEGLFQDQLLLHLKSDWTVDGTTYPQGSLVSADLPLLLEGIAKLNTVVLVDSRSSIDQVGISQDALYLNLLENISNVLYRYTRNDDSWHAQKVDTPSLGSFSIQNLRHTDTDFFLTYEDFLTPSTLYHYRFAQGEIAATPVYALPAFFDAEGLESTQYEAISADGTRIPYFVTARKNLETDGSHPTLLYGYGGFEISIKPGYRAVTGAAWLEKGGVYVTANIRGGGEFGPAWHRAALKENRQRAYDDFIAVAEDLIRRGIATPQSLGIFGGSNGGLLVGVAYTQRPDLFNAVVCAVPLLDMRRYDKLLAGASWVGEYGDPDNPDEWEYISKYSPYQNLNPDQTYPEPLFTTSTRDDRVHPGHARKMMAKMLQQGHPTLYYENTEGGHAGSSTNAQRAYSSALIYTYLWDKLSANE